MNGGIFLINDDGELVEMREQVYDTEALLQEMIAKYPNLLAGDQIDTASPRKWLLISREMSIPLEEGGTGWLSLDHLFLDQDAIPTLVEVKRSSDTRIRREVVGQMLDYAANAVAYWPVEKIISQFEANCEKEGRNPNLTLSEFLCLEPGSDMLQDFWQRVKLNLKAGKIRMIFVADKIPVELRRIVEFLNEQMDPAEVLAVEIKQYIGNSLKTLVPRLIGQTAESQQKKTPGNTEKVKWTEEAFFEEIKKKDIDFEPIARRLLEWSKENMTRVWWGEGSKMGSFVPIINHKERDHQLFAVWTYGTVEIYFYWYKFKAPFDSEEKRMELLRKLNSIEGVNLKEEMISKRPSISLSVFKNKESLDKFIDIYNWVVDEIKKS